MFLIKKLSNTISIFNDLLIDLDTTTASQQTSTLPINTGTFKSIFYSCFLLLLLLFVLESRTNDDQSTALSMITLPTNVPPTSQQQSL